jgi:hypothetical protein
VCQKVAAALVNANDAQLMGHPEIQPSPHHSIPEGRQDLPLLTLGDIEVIEGAAEFRIDLVEDTGWDLQVEMSVAQPSGHVSKGPPANAATQSVLRNLRPGSRPAKVTVCHSFRSASASTTFGFFSSWSLKWSTTAAIA